MNFLIQQLKMSSWTVINDSGINLSILGRKINISQALSELHSQLEDEGRPQSSRQNPACNRSTTETRTLTTRDPQGELMQEGYQFWNENNSRNVNYSKILNRPERSGSSRNYNSYQGKSTAYSSYPGQPSLLRILKPEAIYLKHNR